LVAQAVLILWIFISIAMFAVLSPLRAFLLTYVIGYLLLPVEVGSTTGFTGTIWITQSIRIDKLTSCNLGALIGTAVFASHMFARFRFHWVDIAYGVVTIGVFLTSIVNGLGAKDGVSQGVELLRQFFPLMLLARIYLTSATELYEAMRTIIASAFLYSIIAIAEWRLSPFIHNIIYGYFQHSFDQFMRYSHFRPVGFLRHALEMSFLLGTATAMAAWLWYRKLLTPLWGVIPAWGVLLLLAMGLACTLTFSGYGACLLAGGILGLLLLARTRWILAILPICAIIWMAGRYTNQIDASLLLKTAGYFGRDRSDSLIYRLEAERVNLNDASHNLILGKGGMNGIVREDYGNIVLAVDAWWLIQITFYGLVGMVGWYFIWGSAIIDSWRRWHDMTPDLQTLAAAVSVLLGVQFVDFLFNSFPSPFLLMLDMGLLSTLRFYKPAPMAQPTPAGWPADELQMVPQGASMP
jgi:hypothetical protein